MMATNMDTSCKLHKKPFDSFCFTHYKACCFKCHSKMTGKCDIPDEGRASARLRVDVERGIHNLSETAAKLLTKTEVIDERRAHCDEIEKGCLSEVTQFYDDLRHTIAQSEERARESVREKMREHHENLRELEQNISYITETVAEIQLQTPEIGRVATLSAEQLYEQAPHIHEVTGSGEHVLASLCDPSHDLVTADLKFIGTRCDIDKIGNILSSLSRTNYCSEGSNICDADEGVTEFLRQSEIKVPVTTCNMTCDVTAVACVGSDNSDLIITVKETYNIRGLPTYYEYKLARISEDGEIKYDVVIPCIPDTLHVKGEIVSASINNNTQLAMYKLEDFSPIGTIILGETCSSFAPLSDKFVVCYSSGHVKIRLLTHAGDVVSKAKHTFDQHTALYVRVTSAEDRVIIMQSHVDQAWHLVILSADLQTTLKTIQLQGAHSDHFALCTQRSSVYVAFGGDAEKSVERYDVDGNYKDTIVTRLKHICGLTYNEKHNHLVILLNDDNGRSHLYVYKGHIY